MKLEGPAEKEEVLDQIKIPKRVGRPPGKKRGRPKKSLSAKSKSRVTVKKLKLTTPVLKDVKVELEDISMKKTRGVSEKENVCVAEESVNDAVKSESKKDIVTGEGTSYQPLESEGKQNQPVNKRKSMGKKKRNMTCYRERACEICGKEFPNRVALFRHKKSHGPPETKKFQCSVCSWGFDTKREFLKHSKLHEEMEPSNVEFKSEKKDGKGEIVSGEDKCHQPFAGKGKQKQPVKRTNRKPGEKKKKKVYYKERECGICGRVFPNRVALFRHKKTHEPKEKIQCSICKCGFENKRALLKHAETHEENIGNVSCLQCGIQFTTMEKYVEHIVIEHSDDKLHPLKWVCNICNVQFVNESGYSRHVMSHEKLKAFQCYICETFFSSKNELDEHVKVHGVALNYTCTFCKELCSSAAELATHLKEYCTKRPKVDEPKSSDMYYLCSLCKELCSSAEELATHQQKYCRKQPNKDLANALGAASDASEKDIEELENTEFTELKNVGEANMEDEDKGEESALKLDTSMPDKTKQKIHEYVVVKPSKIIGGHKCDQCGRRFRFPMSLYKHKLLHDESGLFPCRFCEFKTHSYENLVRHSKIHRENQPFKCPECEKQFPDRNSLHNHLRCHSEYKPYLCEECGKSFTNVTQLRRHMNHHSGERPYKCKYCDKTYISMETLGYHENTHTKEQIYMCDECGMTFYRKSSMYTHKKQHMKVKEVQCTKCDKRFNTKMAMKTHYVSMHLTREELASFKYKVYECEVCHKFFSDKNDLVIHNRVHTGILFCICMCSLGV